MLKQRPTPSKGLCSVVVVVVVVVVDDDDDDSSCDMLRIPCCLDCRLTDGGVVVCLTRRPNCNPKKHVMCFWYLFLLEAE
jgi:hypothetical protein